MPVFPTLILFASLILTAIIAVKLAYKRGYQAGHCAGAMAVTGRRILSASHGGPAIGVEDFERHAHSTVHSDLYGTPDWLTHVAFKFFGEAGEFAEHIGKASRDDGWSIFKGTGALNPERRMALLKELGDALWYIVMLAHELGSNLGEVMLINIKKRDGRKERGTIRGAGDNR